MRTRVAVYVVTVVLGILALLLASPILVALVDAIFAFDWARLNDIGQSYAAISAVLSGVALVGIMASLRLHSREVRLLQLQMMRGTQWSLNAMVFDHEFLAEEFAEANGVESKEYLTLIYMGNWVRHLSSTYSMGAMDAEQLRRDAATEIFIMPGAREYWRRWGNTYRSTRNRRRNSFWSIMNEEYYKATDRARAAQSSTS